MKAGMERTKFLHCSTSIGVPVADCCIDMNQNDAQMRRLRVKYFFDEC